MVGRVSRRVETTLRPLALLVIAFVALIVSLPSASAREQLAYAARTLDGAVTAHLHLIKPNGSKLIERGPVSGTLAGSASAEVHAGALFTGSFTIHTSGGSIAGRGTATPHGTGRYESFSGSFLITGGNGRYAHISGHAGLYGVFDRRTDSVLLQTTGRFTY